MESKNSLETVGRNYTIPQLDLSKDYSFLSKDFSYLYEETVVDYGEGYLAHPDSVLLKDNSILTVFPKGHGKGQVLSKISRDGGKTYGEGIENPPKSWKNSKETPTIYRLQFKDKATPDKLILICGNPNWQGEESTGGFNCSLSGDEGKSWSEFKLFYKGQETVVAMASLTHLKENGEFVDKWMGFFHDGDFHNYKTILTFNEKGEMQWSEPEKYFEKYREIEKFSNMCEVECIRSKGGEGDTLLLLARTNSKKINSLISISKDEGKTWSEPYEVPASLNGERHKAEYMPDGRLVISFRSIERDENKNKKYFEPEKEDRGWYSEGWILWVGTFDDLLNRKEGQYRIKPAHLYLPYQNEPDLIANSDCGYCGNVVMPDGTLVTSTYGIFTPDEKRYTYIASKRINLKDTDKLVEKLFK